MNNDHIRKSDNSTSMLSDRDVIRAAKQVKASKGKLLRQSPDLPGYADQLCKLNMIK